VVSVVVVLMLASILLLSSLSLLALLVVELVAGVEVVVATRLDLLHVTSLKAATEAACMQAIAHTHTAAAAQLSATHFKSQARAGEDWGEAE